MTITKKYTVFENYTVWEDTNYKNITKFSSKYKIDAVNFYCIHRVLQLYGQNYSLTLLAGSRQKIFSLTVSHPLWFGGEALTLLKHDIKSLLFTVEVSTIELMIANIIEWEHSVS